MSRVLSVFIIMAIMPIALVYAYEVDTHGAITKTAYFRSTLSSSSLLDELNVQDVLEAFGATAVYYDVSGIEVRERKIFEDYAGLKITQLGESKSSINGWLMAGAIREDDFTPSICISNPGPDQPQDDDYPGPPDRPLNHFYDPINDRGFNDVFLGAKAPDWALGVENAFAVPQVEDTSRRNHYSLRDAQEVMFRALTGHTSAGVPLQPAIDGDLVDAEDIRNAYWATTFRALGDVVHLIQDMAQPEEGVRSQRGMGFRSQFLLI